MVDPDIGTPYHSEPFMCVGEPCINLGNFYTECGRPVDESITYSLSDLRTFVKMLESFAENKNASGRNEEVES